jgi:hypothetical protein
MFFSSFFIAHCPFCFLPFLVAASRCRLAVRNHSAVQYCRPIAEVEWNLGICLFTAHRSLLTVHCTPFTCGALGLTPTRPEAVSTTLLPWPDPRFTTTTVARPPFHRLRGIAYSSRSRLGGERCIFSTNRYLVGDPEWAEPTVRLQSINREIGVCALFLPVFCCANNRSRVGHPLIGWRGAEETKFRQGTASSSCPSVQYLISGSGHFSRPPFFSLFFAHILITSRTSGPRKSAVANAFDPRGPASPR